MWSDPQFNLIVIPTPRLHVEIGCRDESHVPEEGKGMRSFTVHPPRSGHAPSREER